MRAGVCIPMLKEIVIGKVSALSSGMTFFFFLYNNHEIADKKERYRSVHTAMYQTACHSISDVCGL